MPGDKVLPNLVEAHARRVGFCVQAPVTRAHLTAFPALRDSDDLQANRALALQGGYRQGRKTHRVIVAFTRQAPDEWHMHVEIRLPGRRDSSNRPSVVTTEQDHSRLLVPQKVGSSTLRRIIEAFGSGLAGTETVFHAEGEFALPLAEWRPLVQIPFELIGPSEAQVGVDLLGVRLAWRDASRSVIMETLGGETAALRVYLRLRSKLELSGSWAQEVMRLLWGCLSDVVRPLREGE